MKNIYCVDPLEGGKNYIRNWFNNDDAKVMLRYFTDEILSGKKPQTPFRYLKEFRFWRAVLKKPLQECTIDDLKQGVMYSESLNVKPSTKQRRKIALRIFFRWFTKEQNPVITSWFKAYIKPSGSIAPSQLLNPGDIELMLKHVESLPERVLLMLHWESGGRIGETLNIKLKDIRFEDDLVQLALDGKTGPRTIYVFESVPWIRELLDGHPHKSDPEAYLFLNKSGGRAWYNDVAAMIRKLGAQAGIQKPLNTHYFRKSRATYLAKKGWSEAQLCAHLGWVQGSRMPRVYIHLAGTDLKDAVLQLYAGKPQVDRAQTALFSAF